MMIYGGRHHIESSRWISEIIKGNNYLNSWQIWWGDGKERSARGCFSFWLGSSVISGFFYRDRNCRKRIRERGEMCLIFDIWDWSAWKLLKYKRLVNIWKHDSEFPEKVIDWASKLGAVNIGVVIQLLTRIGLPWECMNRGKNTLKQ